MKNFLPMFILLIGAALLVPFGSAKTMHTNADASVVGKWHFLLDTPGGDRPFDADFKLDGDKVSGKWGDADVKGTFSDGKLNLEFVINTEEAGSGTLKLKGTLDGDTLTGDWAFLDYSGGFKGTRAKE